MMRKLLYSFLLITFLHTAGFGQVWNNPITGTNPSSASPYVTSTGQTINPNVRVSGIVKGSGLNSENGNDSYNVSDWNTAISNTSNDYLEFTITPNNGYSINFTSFVYTSSVSNNNGWTFQFRSNVDNFVGNIGTPTQTGTTISLTGASYQNVSSPITFRIYGINSGSTGRTFNLNDFVFNGTVNCIVPTTTGTTICTGSSGTISATSTTSMSVNSFSGFWNGATDPSANMPVGGMINTTPCSFDPSISRNYTAVNFTVSTTGSYVFKMSDTNSYDGMAYIYTGAFTPGSCGGGTWVVGSDDDGGAQTEPRLTATLTAGVVYTLISTTWANTSGAYSGSYTWNVTGGPVTLSPVLWYNAGGTLIGGGSPFNPVGVTGGLANTNTAGTTTFSASSGGASCTRTPANFVINDNNTPTTSVGTYSFCIDSNNTQTTGNISAGQYALVNVVQGYRYTFQVGDIYSGANERINILDATTDLDVSPATSNTGATGAIISNWPAPFSGQIKVVVSTGSCTNNGTAGTGGLTLTLNSVGNSLDDQSLAGATDNTWRGHIYNWTSATLPPGGASTPGVSTNTPFTGAEYVGYYNEAGESITQGFGGDDVCFPVLSNGVQRGSIRTQQFAVRYRMRSTKTGCYMVTLRADDGVRLYIDGVRVADQWQEQSPTTYTNVFVNLTGSSVLVLDYYENGGGNIIEFSMTPFSSSSNTITAPATSTVCSGTSPGLIDGSAYQYNGTVVNPTVRFQWESSSTATGPWANVTTGTGITSEDYTPAAITGNTTQNITYYRRTVSSVTSSSCSSSSTPISITTNPAATLTRTSGAASPTVCTGTAITNIVYTFGGGATSASATGLPAGLSATVDGTAKTLTISGTPTATGTYSVATTGQASPCNPVSLGGTITVNQAPTLVLTSGTASPTVCAGTAITNIVYTFGGGATSASVTGLPGGLSATIDGPTRTVTISGTPTATGTFSVATTGQLTPCPAATLGGTITISPVHTITAGSNRSVCLSSAMTNITMTIGGGATGATVTGLPSGVTSSVSGTTLTISGTPTVAGQFNYSATTTGNSCATATATGTITVGVGNNTISYSNGTSGSVCGEAAENGTVNFVAPAGTYFNTVRFASYGLPTGTCGAFLFGGCHSNTSQSVAETFLLGNSNTVSFTANNANFGDPCNGTVKNYKGYASYSMPICYGTSPGVIIGSDPTGNGTYSYEWQSSTSAAGPFVAITSTNVRDYTPGALTQSTYFRRVVTSNGCSSTSAIVLIKVNPLPTITTAATASTICYGATGTSLVYTATTGTPTTYSIAWNTTPANTFAAVNDATLTTSPISITIPSTAAANTYTGTITVKNANGCVSTGNTFTVTIRPQFTAGAINTTGQTICSGGTPTQIGSATAASGGDGTITYKWQANGVDIASSNSATYTPPAGLTTTTTYRRLANDGTCNTTPALSTGSWTVTVTSLSGTPTVSTITPENCVTKGSVILQGLPSGSWQINQTGTASATINNTGTQYTVTGLSVGSYYFTVQTSTTCASNSTIEVVINDASSTTWNGTGWSNGPPDATKSVIINSAANQPFTANTAACSLTINVPTGTSDPDVTIPGGVTITVTNSVTSNGKLVFESGSSLRQTTDATNYGDIVYKRTTSVRLFDLTYWSMPVTKAGFSMYNLSPNTLWDKYAYFDSALNNWVTDYYGGMHMQTGKGYNIRAPQGTDVNTPSNFTGIFTGVPNNGNIPVAVAAGSWNLLGNPYPSAIDADQLMVDNSLGSVYFWSHKDLPIYNPGDGQFHYNSDFTAYNRTGGTSVSTGGKDIFNGFIAATQGFIAKPAAATVTFNNNQRVGSNNGQFYKTAAVEKNRLWINFSNTEGIFKQILLGYIEGATNTLDHDFDAVSMGANVFIDFYSINSNKKMMIQGRALPFEKSDEVPLGYKLANKGDYTISIDHADGIFNSQDVFLEDKETGKITNLRLEDYTFTTAEGSFNNRFVLRYTSKTLGTGEFDDLENSVVVSVKNRVVKINSTKELLKEVNIYDIGAQLLYNKNNVNATDLQISNLHSTDQALLVKITLENGHTFTKKIIFSNL